MNLLQLIIVVTGFVFLLFSLDLYERKKFNLLHFLVFFCGTGAVVLFVVRPDLLNTFGSFFGLARGADLIVYLSVIFLFYLYFELLNRTTKQNIMFSKVITNLALTANTGNIVQSGNVSGKKNYCFLIRAYNEGSVIGSVLQEIIDAGFTTIVLCDDGSSDETKEVIKSFQTAQRNIILLEHIINRGPGAANKTLFSWAQQYASMYNITWFVTYDADGQMCIEDMTAIMKVATTGKYDVILGSRFIAGGAAHNISLVRRIILRGSRFVTLFFNKIYVTDPTNGYKCIHKDALKKIHLEADGFMYASEFLEEVQKHHLSRVEVPVKIKYTPYSIAKGQKSSNAWKILQNLVYKTFFYK